MLPLLGLYALALALAFSLAARARAGGDHVDRGRPGLPAPARRVRAHDPPLLPVTRVLVTGGAGFVGANLCLALAARHRDWEVVALDNAQAPRLGAQPRAAARGRASSSSTATCASATTCAALEPVEALVECSAEPSVLAGHGRRRRLSSCRRTWSAPTTASSSRAATARSSCSSRPAASIPVAALVGAGAARRPRRASSSPPSSRCRAPPSTGSPRQFPLDGARTLYGATKLAAELLIAEYADAFGVPAVIDRCGVIAGPWQMGKVDQGVFTHWLLAHQLRAAADLHRLRRRRASRCATCCTSTTSCDLVERQLARPAALGRARPSTSAAAREGSLSLLETTRAVPRADRQRGADRAGAPSARPGDVPLYVSDCRAAVRAHRLAAGARAADDPRGHAGVDRGQRAGRAGGARLMTATRAAAPAGAAARGRAGWGSPGCWC